jgi:hypothetical protein
MGFFDAIGKAMADSMSNDENLGKKQNPGFRVISPSPSLHFPPFLWPTSGGAGARF